MKSIYHQTFGQLSTPFSARAAIVSAISAIAAVSTGL
jgi:hypothetical protein